MVNEPPQKKKRPKLMINGWLCLDKPLNLTSTQALGKARWLLGAAKGGHGGTLDPLASGILPLAFGEATKTVEYVMDATKTYRFTLKFGEQRSTDDAEGEVITTATHRPTQAEIAAILPRFIGEIQQKPPIFSALKVAGQRAYDLARQGNLGELPARPVTIHSLAIQDTPEPTTDEISFEVTCGKGTYIRSLARDIALALGSVGYVSALRRTRVGRFCEENAITLDDLAAMEEGSRTELLLPVETALLDTMPSMTISADEALKLRQGQRISLIQASHRDRLMALPETVRKQAAPLLLLANGKAIAIAELKAAELRSLKVFNQGEG